MSKKDERHKISAVIACYLDGQAIPLMYDRLIKTFDKMPADYEIIFVNDGSPDNSEEVLEKIAKKDEQVVVVTHSRNFGSQSAFTSGMNIATGDAVVLLDGDLQDPPELIEKFYHAWQRGFDVVYGERIKREGSWFMELAYKSFYRIFNAISYVDIPPDAGDFSLIDRKVVDRINSLPENNRFIRGLRAWVGYKQTGIPYLRPKRIFGKSTNSLIKNFYWARKGIFSFSFAPLNLIAWLSLIIMCVSMVAILFQVILKILNPSIAPSGFTTLIVIILFMGGIQMFSLAIIGSYLSHVYDEVKRRPAYIVKSISNDPRQRESKSSTL